MCGLMQSDAYVRAMCKAFKYIMKHGHTDTQRGGEETAKEMRRTLVSAAVQPMSKPTRKPKAKAIAGTTAKAIAGTTAEQDEGTTAMVGAAEKAEPQRKCRTFAITPVVTQVLIKMIGGEYEKELHNICRQLVTTSDADATKVLAMMVQLYMDGSVTESRVALAERADGDMEEEEMDVQMDELQCAAQDDASTQYCATSRTQLMREIFDSKGLRGMAAVCGLVMGSAVPVIIYPFGDGPIVKRVQLGGGHDRGGGRRGRRRNWCWQWTSGESGRRWRKGGWKGASRHMQII